jgi:hypothetical protein
MGIDVRLKRDDGEIIGDVDDFRMTLSRATSGPLTSTRLLRYLVPWGDAVFNQAQAGDHPEKPPADPSRYPTSLTALRGRRPKSR